MRKQIGISKFDPIWEKFMSGVEVLYGILVSRDYVLQAATSFGKDSSVMLAMVLEACKIASQRGVDYPAIIISHADTGIENPEILKLNKGEIAKVHSYCQHHRIKYVFSHARPRLMEGYLVRIIGGNKMPTYEDGDAECSKMLKVEPQIRQAKAIAKHVSTKYPDAVLCGVTGVRFDESATRRANMIARGESDIAPVCYNNRWSIAPIANWSEEDVFSFLYKAKDYNLYSSLEKTLEIYADASGSGCVGVGMAISDDQKSKRESKGCGARFGCAVCVRVGEDKSMEAMLQLEQYSYMKEINAFRNFLTKIRWDLSRRCHLGRTISDTGVVTVGPDNFHSNALEEMFRMVLSIQYLENEAAASLGIEPRIDIVNDQFIAAIDLQWSRYGRAKPFHAWAVARDVMSNGNLLRPSEVEVDHHPRVKGFDKKSGGIQVDSFGIGEFSSFRNVFAEAMDEGKCTELAPVQLGKSGSIVTAPLNFDETFAFDQEGLAMFIDYELDRCLDLYHNDQTNPTAAAKFYAQYGCLSANSRGFLGTDKIIQTADIFWLNKLTKLSNEELIGLADPDLLSTKKSEDSNDSGLLAALSVIEDIALVVENEVPVLSAGAQLDLAW